MVRIDRVVTRGGDTGMTGDLADEAFHRPQGDTELVSVKDHDQSVRVWLDSKNISD